MLIIIIKIVLLVLAAKVVASVFTNKKIANIAKCVFWWMTVSIVFPFRAKSLGFIHKKIYSWLLVLISPAAIITYFVVYDIVASIVPLPYDKLLFTSREEIAAITEIEDFPEFEYINNARDDWFGITRTRNKFKNEDDSKLLIEKIERKLSDKENYLWTKDSIQESEKDFWGGDIVYVLNRGWLDTSWMECPKGIKEKWTQVCIAIGEKAFTVKNESWPAWDFEYYYLDPDSLSKLTGVKIPDYKLVNFRYIGIDSGWSAVLELEKKPSKAFLQSLSKSEKWKKLDDGSYEFYSEDRKEGCLWQHVYVDPKSKFVELSVRY